MLERAAQARGGTPRGVVTFSSVRVYAGVPGVWEITRVFLAPEHYAFAITTAGDPIAQIFDGTVVRMFVGSAEVSRDASPQAMLRSHARWTAVVNLSDLEQAVVAPLAASDLPADVREGLSVRFADGATYRLGFDARTLLVWAQGPIDLAPYGAGVLTAHFSDYRTVAGLRLPFAVSYDLAGMRIADETVQRACVDPPGLIAAAFADPASLPRCT